LLYGVSCSSSGLCVAVDGGGNVVTSSNPTGGAVAWTVTHVDDGSTACVTFSVCTSLTGVSCPSSGLCVAVDVSGNVVTSSNPTGGAAAWTVTHVDGLPYGTNALSGVSCTSSGLCVAVDGSGYGNVVTSSNPTGGAAAWTVTQVDQPGYLTGVSCTSGLCVAVDISGNVVTSSSPTGGAAAWTVTNVDGSNRIFGVSCRSSGLCVAVDEWGNVVTSSNPTGGAAAWTVTNVDGPNPLYGVSCPSSGLCVAVDNLGNVVTSSNPTGGAAAWTVTHVDGTNFLTGVSCPSSGLCVAVDDSGNVVIGTGAATTTLTSVASSSNPSTVGASVTYTATVAPTPDGGTVAFTDNTITLSSCGAVAVNTTTGKATCTTGYSAVGSHAIVASYGGDANFGTSNGSLTQHVNASVSAMAVLPAMSNGAYGGYTTAATIQNTGTGPATVRIDYFDQNGAPVGVGDLISSLPVNASWTVRQDNGNSFPSSGGDAAQAGSAVVYSSQPVAAFVNEFAPGNAGDATSYSGVQVPGGVGTTLYAPTIVNNAYGGYTTGIGLLNEGSSPTNVTITYRDGSGAIVKTQPVTALAAHAYRALFSGDTTLALPSGFAGTATITSTAGQPLGAVVNEVGPGGQFSSYDAVASGSTMLNAPVALNNAFGGYYTGMGIQNTSASAGTVTVTYYDASGTPTVKSFNILANGSLGVYQGSATDGPAAGAYTAVIQSTLPLAAIVNEVAPSSTSAQQSTSYNTFSAGSASLNLPLVENAGSDPWNTGEGIMNTGSGSTTVTVNYYDTATGAAIGTPQTQALASHAFWGLYQPTGGLSGGTRATAVITTSSGGQVAAICNESSATTFMSYNGQ
jgi:Bacterial Ig-like domain (group 3)